MGRGNWIPHTPASDETYRLIYAEIEEPWTDIDDIDDIDELELDIRCHDFYDELKECLPNSFDILDPHVRVREFGYSRDTAVLATNALVALVADAQGDFWHQGIAFVVMPDAPAFASSYLEKIADKVFDKLALMYPLSVRNGAWMSSPYPIQPQTAKQ